MVTSKQVGYLVSDSRGGWGVLCRNCLDKGMYVGHLETPVPIFKVNIYPYNQHCASCGKVLVKGIRGWPELFEGYRIGSR